MRFPPSFRRGRTGNDARRKALPAMRDRLGKSVTDEVRKHRQRGRGENGDQRAISNRHGQEVFPEHVLLGESSRLQLPLQHIFEEVADKGGCRVGVGACSLPAGVGDRLLNGRP